MSTQATLFSSSAPYARQFDVRAWGRGFTYSHNDPARSDSSYSLRVTGAILRVYSGLEIDF